SALLAQPEGVDLHAVQGVGALGPAGTQRQHVDRVASGDEGLGLPPHSHVDIVGVLEQDADGFHRSEAPAVAPAPSHDGTSSTGVAPFHAVSTNTLPPALGRCTRMVNAGDTGPPR